VGRRHCGRHGWLRTAGSVRQLDRARACIDTAATLGKKLQGCPPSLTRVVGQGVTYIILAILPSGILAYRPLSDFDRRRPIAMQTAANLSTPPANRLPAWPVSSPLPVPRLLPCPIAHLCHPSRIHGWTRNEGVGEGGRGPVGAANRWAWYPTTAGRRWCPECSPRVLALHSCHACLEYRLLECVSWGCASRRAGTCALKSQQRGQNGRNAMAGLRVRVGSGRCVRAILHGSMAHYSLGSCTR